MKSPGEINGLESKKREEGESESKVKKKVRIVKKIVKKKVIKKVPKRLLAVKDHDNLDNNVVSPNDNISDLVVDNDVVVVEKGNLVDENVKEGEVSGSEKGGFCKDNVGMEIENVKEVEISGREKSVGLVENDDSLTDFEKVGSFKGNDNVVMETEKLDVVDKKEVEVSDRENSVCLVENDDSLMGLEKVASFKGNDDVVMEIEKFDDGKMEVEDRKEFEVSDREKVSVGLVESDNSCRGESEISGFMSSSMSVDRDRIELEDGVNTMDVVEHEGEEDEKSYQTDVGVNESVKLEENVKEILVNSETDGLKSREAVNETREWSEEMVASWWRMKQRTKIFIHGLCNETKEEDIRRIFEELGEVVEVKIITNFRSGKSRGFGFVRFASGELANLALTKFSNVEICGSMCHTAVVEGKDTILLSNIDNEWNNQNVLALLQEIGITKINEVTVVPDSENTELNRGFAFVEFETKRDAQMAYLTLQNKNVFGKHSKIKAGWAESVADPVEEEMHNIKSVYVEQLPSSWNEKEVRDHFKMFGEIESIALAKNLWSTKRNDFAFVNYKTCKAALSCIETLSSKKSTGYSNPQAHLKVSLAKSVPKGKSIKTIPESVVTQSTKVSQKANQSRPSQSGYQKVSQSRPSQSGYQTPSQSNPSWSGYQKASQSRLSQSNPSWSGYQKASQSRLSQTYLGVNNNNMKVSDVIRHEAGRKDGASSTTNELVQLLREQASWKLAGTSPTAGLSIGHQQPFSGGKQVVTELGSRPLYHDPRAYHQTHLQTPNAIHNRQRATYLPHYDPQRAHPTAGSFSMVEANPSHFQIRDQMTYPASGSVYRRMR